MTADELRQLINSWIDEHGVEWKPPKSYEVDAETYGNCCQAIFDWLKNHTSPITLFEPEGIRIHDISLGPNYGLMFKGIELIIKK